MFRFAFVLLLLSPLAVVAQFVAPAASPAAAATVVAGYTELRVDYHRPSVRGRRIFGGLLPWDKPWRAGANENTLLSFDGQVTIGETVVDAGTYSLFVVPRSGGRWTWVINRGTDGWGTRGYEPDLDVVRLSRRARRLPERVETLEYRWMNVSPQQADLVLEWEWYRLTLTVQLPTDKQVAAEAARHLNPAADPNEYYAAARYYLDAGSYRKAKAWIDRWGAEAEPQFGRLRYRAIIEYENGNVDRARRFMEQSLDLARQAGNAHYVRMNQRSLDEWSRTLTEESADSLLARSIRFHDPHGVWGTRSHILQIAESRPGGDTYHTRMTVSPQNGDFDYQQTRGKTKISLRLANRSFSYSYLGEEKFSDSLATRLGITEEATLRLRDYYTYLYGLPMKLRDPGATVVPEVYRVFFAGREMLEVTVRYPADDTGQSHVWRFYFHPETAELKGYGFYDVAGGAGSGEFIELNGRAYVDGMLLPAERSWYMTKDRLFLGTDAILNR